MQNIVECLRESQVGKCLATFIARALLELCATETSRNITARVIERVTSGEIYYFLEDSRGYPELAKMVTTDANLVANDAKMVAKLAVRGGIACE
ncbi:hypothetical protein TNCV_439431 [Trichonephila clavipes]|nr:hypothetical protein TNCV_439431 [Trichonephila clavipes]